MAHATAFPTVTDARGQRVGVVFFFAVVFFAVFFFAVAFVAVAFVADVFVLFFVADVFVADVFVADVFVADVFVLFFVADVFVDGVFVDGVFVGGSPEGRGRKPAPSSTKTVSQPPATTRTPSLAMQVGYSPARFMRALPSRTTTRALPSTRWTWKPSWTKTPSRPMPTP
jgi:hypothetical protein